MFNRSRFMLPGLLTAMIGMFAPPAAGLTDVLGLDGPTRKPARGKRKPRRHDAKLKPNRRTIGGRVRRKHRRAA
jgi:hypothetical protein